MTTATTETLTVSKRISSALVRIQSRFPDLADAKRLEAALMEVIDELIARDRNLSTAVQTRYVDLAPQAKKSASTRSVKTGATKKVASRDDEEPLIPIREVPGRQISLAGPPDPFFLLELYGPHQLERALRRHTLRELQATCRQVEQKYPKTKPKSKASKPPIIAYIVEHVAGPGY